MKYVDPSNLLKRLSLVDRVLITREEATSLSPVRYIVQIHNIMAASTSLTHSLDDALRRVEEIRNGVEHSAPVEGVGTT